MQFARKFGVIFIGVALLLFIFMQFGSCDRQPSENGRNRVAPQPATSEAYEPKFRQDGEAWIVAEATNDTLASVPIEAAQTDEERQYGMMFRKSFSPVQYGMLFFMGEERIQSFWMHNTYIPLDIVYIDNENRIVSIVNNAEPLNDRPLPSERPASLVLELPGGFCLARNINAGDIVHWRVD